MSFKPIDIFIQVFDDLFTYINLEHKFIREIPESSLNSTEIVNTVIGITGDIEGNIMFSHSIKAATDIAGKLMGTEALSDIDLYVKSALADFYGEFCERFINLVKIANMYEDTDNLTGYNLLLTDPTYVSGENMYGVISKVPSKKLFFKINGEKFGIAYSFATK